MRLEEKELKDLILSFEIIVFDEDQEWNDEIDEDIINDFITTLNLAVDNQNWDIIVSIVGDIRTYFGDTENHMEIHSAELNSTLDDIILYAKMLGE